MRDRARQAALAGLLVLVALALTPATVGADEAVSSEELRALAQRARTDPTALEQLREVEEVDGRPMDVGSALEGARPAELDVRLRELSGDISDGGGSAPAARRDAHEILEGDRYQDSELPRPFRGALRWIGERLEPVFGPIGRGIGAVATDPIGALLIGAAVVLTAVFVSTRLIAARGRNLEQASPGGSRSVAETDPAELERQAAEAEASGDLDLAVRLRFQAGLLRLDRRGVLSYRPSLLNGDVALRLHSPTFDELAHDFDEVAYGGRAASASDVAAARDGWPRVLEEASRR